MIWIVATLATYYLALSITSQDGPFAIFLKLRNRYTDDGSWIARGLRCLVCVSCYTALLMTIILALGGHGDPWDWPIIWFGLAGASVIFDRYWKR